MTAFHSSLLKTLIGIFAALLLMTSHVLAQTAPAEAPPAPAKIDQFIQLLSDPEVKTWLEKELAKPDAPASADTQSPETNPMAKSMVSSSLDNVKLHIERTARTIPDLPRQFMQARSTVMSELSDRGLLGVFMLVAIFIAAGFALQKLVFRLTVRYRRWLISLSKDTPQGRAKKISARFLYSFLMILSFSLGSTGAFMIFEWPPLLREIVLAYLTAATGTWAVNMFCKAGLITSRMNVAHAEEVRALPISNETADHWSRWLVIIGGWFLFVDATFSLLPLLGLTADGIVALAIPASFVLLCLGLVAIWRRPRSSVVEGKKQLVSHVAATWLMTVYFIGLWLLQLTGAWVLFSIVALAFVIPLLVIIAHKAVHFILRPGTAETGGATVPAVTLAVVDRGIRVALIVLAIYITARMWGVGMSSVQNMQNPTTSLIVRGLVNTLVIALAADFGWSIIKALIERKLGVHHHTAQDEHAEIDPQQARLRTLLPIISNILFASLLIMAILMILSSIGIQIGPLIAGAGVVGVAIGFGAQTVVKDVISGVFYLLDDAFRIGEYISSGKYMGTVESFSLRSIKLRHHRGPVFTIPFGELGAVQNQSRDWTMDKFNITVGFDTDLEAARKLIKRVGAELAADPEFAPWVIEPIKMQGIQEFGEYGIVIRMKMTTKPGGAFAMKRKFFIAVRKAFKENNIELPVPTVHVQKGEEAAPVVAQNLTARRKRAAVAKAAEDAA
ncbi:mechanosensitive ion channel family protein [Phyllobacterium sp. YR531]|uniref:mechanosensitive ion channel family protein n=1 Tax=Phyllobacterium sp. YR531 TaxID=1144343 RepID=UPI00026F49A0|nr:mechanosensitive ion channel family protein [Phyllobacterium sp. YR531]EJN03096.1 small-conductance mechanosensitive channel [Phyllobacterium sp. YR531]